MEVREREQDRYRSLAGEAQRLYRRSLEELAVEPTLVAYDPWGERVDRIELTPLWQEAKVLTAEHGLVAAGYTGDYGQYDRVHQHLMNYLIQGSLDVYSCPLAMTDGAAQTLRRLPPSAVSERALPRLLSSKPASSWTSGQWMTERTGGSDVGLSETEARPGPDGTYTLHGLKWFTSASTSEMALTLARPVGNPPGGSGLALFYVETRTDDGRLNGIEVRRLKTKLGTRKVPTAELELAGAMAHPLAGTSNGTRHIADMLNITRLWNTVAAAWMTRRAVALARDYARRRVAFGSTLEDKPLHADTLAGAFAEAEAVFHLAFRVAELRGQVEHGDQSAAGALRILTPVAKLCTAKQAVSVTSEMIESFGGAGYVEDTGLPQLLCDAQVLPIWEGTTNVLSLDTLRALAKEGGLEPIKAECRALLAPVTEPALAPLRAQAELTLASAEHWLAEAFAAPAAREHEARRFALTLGRTIQLCLMLHHAQTAGSRAAAVARRFAAHGIDRLAAAADPHDTREIVG